jgi:hypothetical protein
MFVCNVFFSRLMYYFIYIAVAFISSFSWAGDTRHIVEQKFKLIGREEVGEGVGVFRFKMAGIDCTLSQDGKGACIDGKKPWRFSLPVYDGQIESLYVAPGKSYMLAYNLANDESMWGGISLLDPAHRKPRWSRNFPVVNMDAPQLTGRSTAGELVVLGAAQLIVALSVSDGSVIWQHQWMLSRSGGVIPELDVNGNTVRLIVREPVHNKITKTACYALSTGEVADCGLPPGS